MLRTQIQLEESQARRLKDVAHREGVSMAEIIRRCVDQALPSIDSDLADRYEQAAAVVGKYRSGHHDTAERHDDHLTEAFS